MSGFNTQISIDHSIIPKLPWIKQTYQYFFDKEDLKYRGIVYNISEEDYNKVKDRFCGQSTNIISKGDKVYIMPGSRIPSFKIKDHLNKIGATRTGDIHKATCFIGNNKVSNSLLYHNPFPIVSNGEIAVSVFWGRLDTDSSSGLDESIINKYPAIFVNRHSPDYDWMTEEELEMFFITPAGVNIVYNSILKNLPIIGEDTFMDQIEPMIVIDKDVYDTLNTMLSSSDNTNYDVARELIANCDIKKSIFYLRQLANKFNYIITNSRMKNLKLFVERSEWNNLRSMTAEEFTEYLYNKDYLTPEMFKELVIESAKNYEDKLESPVFKMILIPSDKYKDYVEPGTSFEYHHEDEDKIREEELIPETNETDPF